VQLSLKKFKFEVKARVEYKKKTLYIDLKNVSDSDYFGKIFGYVGLLSKKNI
jgi:hypothetical protein